MYRSIFAISAVAGGLLLATAPASAQSYGYSYDYSGPANEEVIITAPRTPQFREQGSGARSLDMPPERVSLSKTVRYDDLDLTSYQGAMELRHRVRMAARNVCGTLREAYPFHQLSTADRCYREAVDSALVRADSAISDAIFDVAYRYDYDAY